MKHITIKWDKGRAFTCGDIHGCYDDFMNELEKVNFNFDEDIVICTGDMVDRGPNSLDCFNLIYKSWFKSVRGNHEQFCLEYLHTSQKIKHMESHTTHGGTWFYKLPMDVKLHICSEIERLPILITLERNNKKYGFVHGNIPTYARTWSELIDFINSASLGENTINDCMMERTKARLAMNPNTDENIFKYNDVDKIYLGHTTIKKPITRGNMTFIDTGCVYKNGVFGKLTLLEIK